MQAVPDFNSAERWVVDTALRERYGEFVPVECAEAELKLDPETPVLTTCPTLYWERRGCHFALFKVGEDRYRSVFFYDERAQYGTGRAEYDELAECVVTLLRVQADHEKERQGVRSGMTGREIGGRAREEES
jgi:hypothetical protein